MKLLIVKTSSLGDIVHCFPVVDYLRAQVPTAQIDWVVEAPFASLVQNHPHVHHVYTIDSRKWRGALFRPKTLKDMMVLRRQLRREHYDIVFDLQGNMKSAAVTAACRAHAKVGYGVATAHEWPNALFMSHRFNPPKQGNVREEYLYLVKSMLQKHTNSLQQGVTLSTTEAEEHFIEHLLSHHGLHNRLKVMVCPGSNWRNKQMSPEALKEFLTLLEKEIHCAYLFTYGNEQEKQTVTKLQQAFNQTSILVDKMRLPALQNLMGKVDLVISMDSLPLHLAATTSTPTFSVFGASSAEKYKPIGERHFAFQGPCPYGRTFERRCPILRTCPTGACIQDLSGQTVFTSFMQWWTHLGR